MSEEKASLPGSTSPPPTAPAPPQVAAPVPAAAPAMGAPAFTPTPQPPPYLAPAPVMVPRVGGRLPFKLFPYLLLNQNGNLVITPMHQPAIMGVTTVPHAPVVMVNPLMAASSIYGPQPIHTKCQFCEATVLTRITQNMSGQGWILVVVLILM